MESAVTSHVLSGISQCAPVQFAAQKHVYVLASCLPAIEKMIRLHYDLQINFEGIDAISQLLNKIETLQQNLLRTQNKLRLYEENERD